MPKGVYIRTAKHLEAMRGVETREAKCGTCEKPVKVYASRAKIGRSKFCSRECAHSSFSKYSGENNPFSHLPRQKLSSIIT